MLHTNNYLQFLFFFGLLFSVSALAAEPAAPCVGIRGNGELAPAHWAGLARIVEDQGMPRAVAGGSSATVSMFFLDSIAGNSAVTSEQDPARRRRMQALLLKSLPEFTAVMARTDGLASAYEFIGQLQNPGSSLMTNLNRALRSPTFNSADLRRALGKYSSLLNPDLLRTSRSPAELSRNVRESLAVFGKFDAQNDRNLFFRPGLVDFRQFALVLGSIADFYAGNTDPQTRAGLDAFTRDCADSAFQRQWQQMPDSSCRTRFQGLVQSYLQRGEFQNRAVFGQVGANIAATPTTSLLQGEGLRRYNEMRTAYARSERRDYQGFHISFEQDLRFGYWGSPERLNATDRGLERYREEGDLKSQRFLGLGAGNWFEVLATSPAEPGLANMQRIPVGTTREQVLAEMRRPPNQRWNGLSYRTDAVSAGGWSDLHPTLVLRAQGCSRCDTTYLTRQSGDSVFGQQTFIRLTGQQSEVPFWTRIGERNNEGWPVAGTPAAMSPWNRIYNLGNQESSFRRSLREAGAALCTDWNRFDTFKGEMWPMVEEAYCAPMNRAEGCPAIPANPNCPAPAPAIARAPGCALPSSSASVEGGSREPTVVPSAE